jgi:hypothetical protein
MTVGHVVEVVYPLLPDMKPFTEATPSWSQRTPRELGELIEAAVSRTRVI